MILIRAAIMSWFIMPRYETGMLVRVNLADKRYCMLIKDRRIIRLKGASKYEWVYDGVFMEIRRMGKEIEVTDWQYVSCPEYVIHSVIA